MSHGSTTFPAKISATRKGSLVDGRQFRLCFELSADKLQPASDGSANSSEMYITSYTKKGRPNLTALNIARVLPEVYPGLILGDAVAEGPEQSSGSSSKRVFKVSVGVATQSRSGRYPIEVGMTIGKQTAEQRVGFTLPILVPTNNSVLVKPKNQSLVDCWAGSNCSALELEVQNKLPYKVSIANISIASGDLLDSQPTGNYLIDIDTNSVPRDLSLIMTAKRISLSRMLRGLGLPELKFRIDYRDEYGRSFSTESQANLEVRPNFVMIALLLIIGAAIGTYFRLDPGRLQRINLTTRKQQWGFMATTFASGIFVCLLAIFFNIKIVVFSNDNSLSAWDPKMLFATALVATFGGLPLIYAYFKIPQPKDQPSSDAKPSGNNNN